MAMYEGLPRMAQGKKRRAYTSPQGEQRMAMKKGPLRMLSGEATEGKLSMKKRPLRVYTPPKMNDDGIGTGRAAGRDAAAPSGSAGASAPPRRNFGTNPDLMDYMNGVTNRGGGQVGQAGANRKYSPPRMESPTSNAGASAASQAKPAASASRGPYKPSGAMDEMKTTPGYKMMDRYGKKNRMYQKPKM